MLAALAFTGWGQEFRGSIAGEVTDPSGAAIKGVSVAAGNVDRKTQYSTVSNEAGRYVTPPLPPGTYTLTFEMSGFKKVVRDGIRLGSTDRLDIDVKMEVGALTESVTVTGEVPLLQTESASRAATVEQKFIQDIPVSGRNMFQFQYSLPGVTKTSNYWGSYELYAFGNINGVSINGGRQGENEVLLDGTTSTRGSRGASFAPSLNAIQEVNILTNQYDASYGRIGGGVTSITLRTGTNTLHGELYEYLKNDNLAANSYLANALSIGKPEYKNNTFGFTVDGPVYIPKVFDGRNKLFFMVSTEMLRERNPQLQLWTVPTDKQHAGDFSETINNSRQQIVMYDPMTTRLGADGRYTRTPFAGNRIPANRQSPVALKTASFYPRANKPSDSPDGLNNYIYVSSSRNSYTQWLGKMDWNITSKSRVSWRYGETPWYNWARIQWGTNAAEPSGEFPSTRISRNWGADWTYTLTPSVLLNLRGGLARYEGFSGNTFAGGFNPVDLGFPQQLVSQFTALQFPRFNFSGGNNISPLGATRTSNYETQDTWNLQANLSMVRGRHNLKYGVEGRRYNDSRLRPESASGNYTFGRNWTQANPQQADALAGNDFATFLLGYPTSGYVDRNMDPSYRNSYFALFFQDDWKLKPRLALNLGLRWDYESPIVERYNRQVRGFAFDQASPIQGQVQGLKLNGGLMYAGSSGEQRMAFERSFKNIQPRIGVAWQFASKWVMRAGYGLTYLGQNASGPDTGFSRPTSLVASTDNNLTPAVTLSDPFPSSLFPDGLLKPIGSSQGLATNLGLGVSAQHLNRPLPMSHQFSFGLQRELFWNWLVDASYVGNLSRDLAVNLGNLNFIPAQELERLPVADRPAYFNQQVPNPMRGLLTPGSGINGATVPRQQLLYAYPHFTGVGISNIPMGYQDYHSLQVKGTRRFQNGLAAQVSYTWSKTLEAVSTLNPQDTNLGDLTRTRLEKRLQQWDIPHTLAVLTSYELPFGKGKRYMNGANRVTDAFLGGWNLNVQYFVRAGTPFDFPNAGPLSSKSAKLSDDERDALAQQKGRDKFDPHYDKWFNTSVFPTRAQAQFTLRDFPTRFPDVRGPALQSWEISTYKQFQLYERLRLQVRADFQNAFNTPYFGRIATTSVQDSRFGQLNPEEQGQQRIVVLVMKLLF
jgi:hypothetical protein